MDAQQSLKPEVSVQSRVLAPQMIWINTVRPHRYFPHIMLNHYELINIDDAIERWHQLPTKQPLEYFLGMNSKNFYTEVKMERATRT